MAGIGRAPKDPGQRRRYNQPARGEWVDLEPLVEPVLPVYRRVFTVPKRLWDGWRADAVCSQWSDADVAYLIEVAIVWDELGFADQDRRLNALGLTPKGKRDLRWRTPGEVKTIKANEAKQADVRQLRVVADEEEKP